MSGSAHDARLTGSVTSYARALAKMTAEQLVAPWPRPAADGERWSGYDDDARGVALLVHLKLCALASEISAGSPAPSRAALIAARHHRAYRDLTGALVGVGEQEFDRPPAPEEWPLRAVVYHIAGAEMGFSLLIRWAVERQRAGDGRPIVMSREEMAPHYATVSDEGSMAEVLARFDALHWRIVREFSDLSDDDLEAPNVWWEGYEIPVWFRMHRFDAHLQEHVIQVDKTLAGIGHPPSEPERLARLLHLSLADIESALIGAPAGWDEAASALASEIELLASLLPVP